MDTNDSQEDIVSDYYDNYKQTQKEIFEADVIKVRNAIFWIGGLLFASDLLGLAMANLIVVENILYALLFPAIFIAFGLLAIKQPMISIVLSIVLFGIIIFITIRAFGSRAAINGILIKAIIVYLLISGFQSAKSAELARKEFK